jgi:GNAT superfamily N-acetyltransferase
MLPHLLITHHFITSSLIKKDSPMLAELPPTTLTTRAPQMEDVDAIVELFNAHSRDLFGEEPYRPENFTGMWTAPGFNLETDALVALSPDGEVIGYMDVGDQAEPHVLVGISGRVHLRHRRQGIGTQLMQWAEQRARQAIEKAPADARVVMQSGCSNQDTSTIALLESQGFTATRHFFRMLIEIDGAPPAPVWPDGLTMRAIDEKTELEEAVRTYQASFQDHWGYTEVPFELMLQYIQHMMAHDSFHDSSLWFAAFDGDQMAAICLCDPRIGSREDTALVNILGVRREWRKKGLGLAFLHHAFGEFYRRGIPRAVLGVDAGSLTGATRLYERAGMRVERVNHTYGKVLREGKDLTTTSL